MRAAPLPLVYSCSGCSGAAQLANALALRLDREGIAEMSCVAGIGGGVKALLRRARQARQRVTLDGCALRCARACLEREGIEVTLAVDLSDLGIRKHPGGIFDPADEARLWHEEIVPSFTALAESGDVGTTQPPHEHPVAA